MRIPMLFVTVVAVGCSRAPTEPAESPASPVVTTPAPAHAAVPAPAAPSSAPDRISASHVLVMWHGSMRSPPTVTRSRDEARTRAEEVLRRARAGEDFAALARQYSDEPNADHSGGSLGTFGHGQMVPAFDRAAFALRTGQVSDIIETDFGFHVIKRTQ